MDLKDLLDGMDVPEQRKHDLGWLRRNLPIRNSDHPDFRRAFRMVLEKSMEEDSVVALEGLDVTDRGLFRFHKSRPQRRREELTESGLQTA